jgi:peptidoglycan/LPS O-acetylase OafA/YrhL
VFENNPFRKAVNGSLWTMPWEVKMYIALLGIGVVAKATQWRDWVWKALVVAIFTSLTIIYLTTYFLNLVSFINDEKLLRLFFMFFAGARLFLMKDRIYIGHSTGLVALLCVALSQLVGKSLFLPVYTLMVSYIVLYLAFIPRGEIRNFNKLGDYSYGVYIYAFPIQQSVVAFIPGISGINLFLTAFPCVLLCSVMSWHFVEKKCLRLKSWRLICG